MSRINLTKRYPPSKPCACHICLSYCSRPGWWTVEEAASAIGAGYAGRMMLELSPEFTFGVLAPAFKGNEGGVALQIFARQGCTFLQGKHCELFETSFRPLECRFCHHTRQGRGKKCHLAIEKDWCSQAGQRLIMRWGKLTGFFERQGLIQKPGFFAQLSK
jgi:hypothetical protein